MPLSHVPSTFITLGCFSKAPLRSNAFRQSSISWIFLAEKYAFVALFWVATIWGRELQTMLQKLITPFLAVKEMNALRED